MKTPKVYRTKKLLTLTDVQEFSKGKPDRFIVCYKNGYALVVKGNVIGLYMGKNKLKNAKKSNLK